MIICVGQFIEALGGKVDWGKVVDRIYFELEWSKKQLRELNERCPPKNNIKTGE